MVRQLSRGTHVTKANLFIDDTGMSVGSVFLTCNHLHCPDPCSWLFIVVFGKQVSQRRASFSPLFDTPLANLQARESRTEALSITCGRIPTQRNTKEMVQARVTLANLTPGNERVALWGCIFFFFTQTTEMHVSVFWQMGIPDISTSGRKSSSVVAVEIRQGLPGGQGGR